MLEQKVKIVNVIANRDFGRFLYKCLAPTPFRLYRSREEYLERATAEGFHKKLLIFDGDVVGQIEYAPARFSGYPISGDDVVVMNCIWVLSRAKGHGFGKMLVEEMVRSEENAVGFATIALENHWSPWFKRSHMEKLGFKPIDKIDVKHKTKHREQVFSIWLMWMQINEDAKQPSWNREKLLEGVTFCLAAGSTLCIHWMDRQIHQMDDQTFWSEVLPVTKKDVARTLRLMSYSREDLLQLVSHVSDECFDWKPPDGPRTIRNCLRHIGYVEPWYISRLDVDLPRNYPRNIFKMLDYTRKIVVEFLEKMPREKMRGIYQPKKDPSPICNLWTARKVLRRLVDHERLHAKYIEKALKMFNSQR